MTELNRGEDLAQRLAMTELAIWGAFSQKHFTLHKFDLSN